MLHDFAYRWLILFLDVCCQSLVVGLAWALAMLLLSRASAAIRSAASAATILSLLALPVCNAILPAWHSDWIERSASPFRETLMPNRTESDSPAIALPLPETDLNGPGQEAAAPRNLSSPAAASPRTPRIDWAFVAFAVWIIGSAWSLLKLLQSYRLAQRVFARSHPADASPQFGRIREHASAIRVFRPVAVRIGDGDAPPMTWGFLRPVLLLPAGAADWPPAQLDAVVIHELAHIRRGDWLVHMLSHVTCYTYWFHPLAWLASRRLAIDTEKACDDCVLSAGIPACDYAEQLLTTLRGLAASRHPAALAMAARGSAIHSRVQAVLDTARSRRRLTWPAAVIALAIIAMIVLPLGACQPSTARTPDVVEGNGPPEPRNGPPPNSSGADSAPVPAPSGPPPATVVYTAVQGSKPPSRMYTVKLHLVNHYDYPIWIVMPSSQDHRLPITDMIPTDRNDSLEFEDDVLSKSERSNYYHWDRATSRCIECYYFIAHRLGPHEELRIDDCDVEAWAPIHDFQTWEVADILVNGQTPLQDWLKPRIRSEDGEYATLTDVNRDPKLPAQVRPDAPHLAIDAVHFVQMTVLHRWTLPIAGIEKGSENPWK